MQKQPPPGAYPPGTKLTVGTHAVTIKSYISEGGFAHVYVVNISPPSAEGDIACLKRVVVPDKIHLNLLRAEVDAMKRLKGHPNIVRYIDSHAARLNSQGGLPPGIQAQLHAAQGNGSQIYEVFLLMEYCSGNGLIDFMNTRLREQLTESEILKITCDVSYGLACMHYLQPPLIHRDLKIENILISSDGTYKLCDFGSVSPVLRPPRNPTEFHILEEDIQRHTTAQYRSPEMIDIYRGFPIDEKSDIWALGVFLYKLCYYITPFEREGNLAILHANFVFPPKPGYSDRLKGVISGLLREDPRMRPNIYQVLKELCNMRGIEVPIKDIYSQPVMVPTTTTANIAAPIPVQQPQGVIRSVVQDQSKLIIPEVTPMFRGRITIQQNNSMPSLDRVDMNGKSNKVDSNANFSDDPFALLDQKAKTQPVTPTVKPSSTPLDFDIDVDSIDISKRFPSLEDLTKELEKRPFEFNEGQVKSTEKSTEKSLPSIPKLAAEQISIGVQTQDEEVKSEVPRVSQRRPLPPKPQPPSQPPSQSPPQTQSQTQPKLPQNRPQQKPPPPPSSKSPPTQTKSAPPTQPKSTPPTQPKSTPPTQPKPQSSFSSSSSQSSSEIDESSLKHQSAPSGSYPKPIPRPPSKVRPRPVSMYSQTNSDSYFDHPHEFKYPLENGITTNTTTGSLIDYPEEREQLKEILTGLSQRSSIVVLDTSENHIDSNVDFLKALDNEHTGTRPQHHRKSSQSQYLHASGTGDQRRSSWMSRSNSTSRRSGSTSSRHDKKSSISSISSIKGKINDAFKIFDNNATTYRSTSDSSMIPPRAKSANSNHPYKFNRINFSNEQLNDYDKKLNGSIQNRVQQLLSNDSPPPKKTATGYGKYTERETSKSPPLSLSSTSSTTSMPPPSAPIPSSSRNKAQKLEQEVQKEIKRASLETTRDWIESTPSTLDKHKFIPKLLSKKESSHSRQLSVISSESSSSTTSNRKPPTRPKKPAHLQSPRRGEKTPVIDDDWEERFNQKYPSLG